MESLPKPSFFIGIIGIRIPTNQPGFKTVDYFISPSDPITSPLEVASAGTCAAIFLSFTLRSLEDLVWDFLPFGVKKKPKICIFL